MNDDQLRLLERIMNDSKLSANEIRILIYAIFNEYFTTKQIVSLFDDCNPQYANHLIISLEKKDYLIKHSKLKGTRRYIYMLK